MPAPPAATDGCMRAITIQSQEEMIAPLQGQITNSQAQQGLQQRKLPACWPMTVEAPRRGGSSRGRSYSVLCLWWGVFAMLGSWAVLLGSLAAPKGHVEVRLENTELQALCLLDPR